MDESAKRSALRLINYPVYVLTSRHGEEVAAGSVTWLSQVSFVPPLLVVGVKVESKLHELISDSKTFAVNILGSDQKDLAGEFFKPTKVEGSKLNGISFEDGKNKCPILPDSLASLECKVSEIVKKGDHSVVVGEVVEAHMRKEARQLFTQDAGWFYGG